MPNVLVIYDSRSGNTEKMANAVAEGVKDSGVALELKTVDDAVPGDLVNADGIIIGSPNYFGSMSDKMKVFIDTSVKVRKKLENKVGAAFCSTGAIGGGGETVLMTMLHALLIHGMIIVGDPMKATGHYGAIAVGAPDEGSRDVCRKLGRRVGELVLKLA